MPDTVFGFRRVDATDHVLAAFLRKHGAIDTYEHVANSCTWYAPDDRAVAVCFYNNAEPSYTCWVRDDLEF